MKIPGFLCPQCIKVFTFMKSKGKCNLENYIRFLMGSSGTVCLAEIYILVIMILLIIL